MKTTSSLRRFHLLAGSLLAFAATAHAQTTWTGSAGDNDWHNATNWSNGLPGTSNRPIIENAGAVVNLTQNVTTSGGSLDVRALVGTGAPATLNIAADLNLSGGNIILGVGQADGLGWYRAVVNQTAGDVVGNAFRLAQRPNESGAASEYNLSGGTLGVATFRVGELGGTGVFNMYDGSEVQTTAELQAGLNAGSVGTINMHGGKWTHSIANFIIGSTNGTGTLNMHSGAEIIMNSTFHVGRGGTATFNMYGGSLTGDGSLNAGRNNGGNGTWNIYSGSVIETTNVIYFGRETGSTGTLRTWLDGSAFIPIKSTNETGLQTATHGGTANLDVALVGGVMLTDRNEFHLVDAGGQVGSWTSTPNAALWDTVSGSGQVTVGLQSTANHGTLDAATLGNTINLTAASSVGYVTLANVNMGSALHLRLGIDEDSISGSNFSDFILDLADAGYGPLAFGSSAVDIMFDPQVNGADYFAWDLSAYTTNPTLAVEWITVIPEPSSALYALLPALGLLIRRRQPCVAAQG